MSTHSVPYTYLIGWSSENKWYYGVRCAKNAHPTDLWVTYFTSSKHVAAFRIAHGEPDVIQIRRVFNNPQSAKNWEYRVLKSMWKFRDKWINRRFDNIHFATRDTPPWNKGLTRETDERVDNIHKKRRAPSLVGELNGMFGKRHTAEARQKQSDWQRGKPKGPQSEEHKRNRSIALTGIVRSEETRQKYRDREKNRPIRFCEQCNRHIKGDGQWTAHLRSQRHTANQPQSG